MTAKKYRIGWEQNGKWHYIFVEGKEEMIAEVADKSCISTKVSIKEVSNFKSK